MNQGKIFYQDYKVPKSLSGVFDGMFIAFVYVAIGIAFFIAPIRFYFSGILATILYSVVGLIAGGCFIYFSIVLAKEQRMHSGIELNKRMIILLTSPRKIIWLEDITRFDITIIARKKISNIRTENVVKKYVIWEGKKKYCLDFYEGTLWTGSELHVMFTKNLQLGKADFKEIESVNEEGFREVKKTYVFNSIKGE